MVTGYALVTTEYDGDEEYFYLYDETGQQTELAPKQGWIWKCGYFYCGPVVGAAPLVVVLT